MRGLIIFFLITLVTWLQGQSVHVLQVEGSIYADDQVIQAEDKIAYDSKLKFSTPESIAHVVYPGKGYYILSEIVINQGKNAFLVSLQDALIPPGDYFRSGTRYIDGGDFQMEDIYDLKALFRGNLLAIDVLNVPLKPDAFELNDSNYFSIIADEEDVNIVAESDNITIGPGIFGGSTAARLFYHSSGKEELIGEFVLRFMDSEDLFDRMVSFKKMLGDVSEDTFRLMVRQYIHHAYGRTNPHVLSEMIKKVLSAQSD